MDNVNIMFSVNREKLPFLRAALKVLFAETTCKIEFEKVNGTQGEMKCSLRNNLIPKSDLPKGSSSDTKAKKENIEVLPVYKLDGDKPGWRSFRMDSLQRVEVLYE